LKDGAERVGNDSNDNGGKGCERKTAPFGGLASTERPSEKGKRTSFIVLGETSAGRGGRKNRKKIFERVGPRRLKFEPSNQTFAEDWWGCVEFREYNGEVVSGVKK